MACTPGMPPSDARTDAATARTTAMSSVASSTLYATSGARAPTRTTPERVSIVLRPVVRLELSFFHETDQPVEPAASKEGGASFGADLAVAEYGQAEFLTDTARQLPRSLDREQHLVRAERNQRDDVGGADAGMDAHVPAQIDELGGAGDTRQKRVDERVRLTDEREHRAMVIGIGVDVEERDVLGKRLADRGHHGRIPPLGDVGHGLEHDPYPTKPCLRTTPQAPRARAGARSAGCSGSCARTARRSSSRRFWPSRPRSRGSSFPCSRASSSTRSTGAPTRRCSCSRSPRSSRSGSSAARSCTGVA